MLLPGKRLPLSQILTHPGPLPNVESEAIKGYSSGAVAPDWHISGEPKPGFPTVLHRAPESSLVIPSLTASGKAPGTFLSYSLQLWRQLLGWNPACWITHFLFLISEISVWCSSLKKSIIFRGKKNIYIYSFMSLNTKPVNSEGVLPDDHLPTKSYGCWIKF